MRIFGFHGFKKNIFYLAFLAFPLGIFAQDAPNAPDFWDHVQFGGGLGLSIGSGYTDITLAPGAIYNFNEYFSAGVGLQGSYVSQKNWYSSYIYGGSLVGLFNPIEEVQLSVELEQVRVNSTFDEDFGSYKDNFWNTGLFLGAGYRNGNITIGARYNLLYDKDRSVYSDAFMPFVRVYF
ncbi:MAG: hypothetical protein PSV16_02690 [Flavobacterium sp.]|nr:hypothetical protein [Flavobacterium sp.]